MYCETVGRKKNCYASFVQKGNSKTVYLYMAQTMQTCKACSTTVQSELIISSVRNIQGTKKDVMWPSKESNNK